jgi:UDP-N-acetylmuramate--alanine ligase
VKEALATFHGVARRFTIVDEVDGVALVDDYGHHPAEVEATLNAARRAYEGRILVAFQPHRYTRTENLFDEFTRAFNNADQLFLTDIYAAGEKPIPGITSQALADAIAQHGHHSVKYAPDRAAMSAELAKVARPGDVVIALGAGDINKILSVVGSALRARLSGSKTP